VRDAVGGASIATSADEQPSHSLLGGLLTGHRLRVTGVPVAAAVVAAVALALFESDFYRSEIGRASCRERV